MKREGEPKKEERCERTSTVAGCRRGRRRRPLCRLTTQASLSLFSHYVAYLVAFCFLSLAANVIVVSVLLLLLLLLVLTYDSNRACCPVPVAVCAHVAKCVRVCAHRENRKPKQNEQQEGNNNDDTGRGRGRASSSNKSSDSVSSRDCVGRAVCSVLARAAAAAHLLTLTAAHRALAQHVFFDSLFAALLLLAQRRLRLLSFCEQRRVSM